MSDTFQLKWENHNNVLTNVLHHFLERELLVDVTIACEYSGDLKFYKAHQMILSACSPYFQSLFTQISNPNPVVFLKDVGTTELESVLTFIYKGEVSVEETNLKSLLEVAKALMIKGLGEHADNSTTIYRANPVAVSCVKLLPENNSNYTPRRTQNYSQTTTAVDIAKVNTHFTGENVQICKFTLGNQTIPELSKENQMNGTINGVFNKTIFNDPSDCCLYVENPAAVSESMSVHETEIGEECQVRKSVLVTNQYNSRDDDSMEKSSKNLVTNDYTSCYTPYAPNVKSPVKCEELTNNDTENWGKRIFRFRSRISRWVDRYSWLQYDNNTHKMFCKYCRKWNSTLPNMRRTSFVDGNCNFRFEIVKHHNCSKTHQICMDKEMGNLTLNPEDNNYLHGSIHTT